MKLSAFLAGIGAFSDVFWARYPHPLLLQEGADTAREVFTLRAGDRPLTIGRDAPCELLVSHPSVSGRHARLHPPAMAGGAWRVEDLGSTNGTTIDGAPLEPLALADLPFGARLGLGPALAFVLLDPGGFRARLLGELTPQVPPDGRTVRIDPPRREPAPAVEEAPADAAQELFIYCEPLDPRPLPDGAVVVVGRKPGECDWVLPDPELSKRHLELRRQGGRVLVRDLGSTNGTYLEGKRLAQEPVELFPRRHLMLGPFELWVDGPERTTGERFSPARNELIGRLETTPLRQLLTEIEAQGKAGSLTVEGGGVRGRVSFSEGRPCQATIEGGEVGTGAIRCLLALREGAFTLREERLERPPTRRIRKTFGELVRAS